MVIRTCGSKNEKRWKNSDRFGSKNKTKFISSRKSISGLRLRFVEFYFITVNYITAGRAQGRSRNC